MKKAATIIALALTFVGCQGDKVRLIWSAEQPPAASVTAPPGFKVSPSEAYSRVLNARRLSMKHVWHLYADDRNYYVIDSFPGSSAGMAVRSGVVVDGQTGELGN